MSELSDARDGRMWVRAIFPKEGRWQYEQIARGIYVNHAPCSQRGAFRFYDDPANYVPCAAPPKSSLIRWLITGRPWRISK